MQGKRRLLPTCSQEGLGTRHPTDRQTGQWVSTGRSRRLHGRGSVGGTGSPGAWCGCAAPCSQQSTMQGSVQQTPLCAFCHHFSGSFNWHYPSPPCCPFPCPTQGWVAAGIGDLFGVDCRLPSSHALSFASHCCSGDGCSSGERFNGGRKPRWGQGGP